MPPVPYHLGKFPPENIDWTALIPGIGKARGALGSYNGLLSAIPEAGLLLSPLTTNEARLSSQIEGTNVTLSEVLEVEAGGGCYQLSPLRTDGRLYFPFARIQSVGIDGHDGHTRTNRAPGGPGVEQCFHSAGTQAKFRTTTGRLYIPRPYQRDGRP